MKSRSTQYVLLAKTPTTANPEFVELILAMLLILLILAIPFILIILVLSVVLILVIQLILIIRGYISIFITCLTWIVPPDS